MNNGARLWVAICSGIPLGVLLWILWFACTQGLGGTTPMMVTISFPRLAGTCRWCGCTAPRPDDRPCRWADDTQSICSTCIHLEALLATVEGRRWVARTIQAVDAAPRGHLVRRRP
jgi:hypothetical protein